MPRGRNLGLRPDGCLLAASQDTTNRLLALVQGLGTGDGIAHQLGDEGILVLIGEDRVEGVFNLVGDLEADGGHLRNSELQEGHSQHTADLGIDARALTAGNGYELGGCQDVTDCEGHCYPNLLVTATGRSRWH
jgi:hypothetical protein